MTPQAVEMPRFAEGNGAPGAIRRPPIEGMRGQVFAPGKPLQVGWK